MQPKTKVLISTSLIIMIMFSHVVESRMKTESHTQRIKSKSHGIENKVKMDNRLNEDISLDPLDTSVEYSDVDEEMNDIVGSTDNTMKDNLSAKISASLEDMDDIDRSYIYDTNFPLVYKEGKVQKNESYDLETDKYMNDDAEILKDFENYEDYETYVNEKEKELFPDFYKIKERVLRSVDTQKCIGISNNFKNSDGLWINFFQGLYEGIASQKGLTEVIEDTLKIGDSKLGIDELCRTRLVEVYKERLEKETLNSAQTVLSLPIVIYELKFKNVKALKEIKKDLKKLADNPKKACNKLNDKIKGGFFTKGINETMRKDYVEEILDKAIEKVQNFVKDSKKDLLGEWKKSYISLVNKEKKDSNMRFLLEQLSKRTDDIEKVINRLKMEKAQFSKLMIESELECKYLPEKGNEVDLCVKIGAFSKVRVAVQAIYEDETTNACLFDRIKLKKLSKTKEFKNKINSIIDNSKIGAGIVGKVLGLMIENKNNIITTFSKNIKDALINIFGAAVGSLFFKIPQMVANVAQILVNIYKFFTGKFKNENQKYEELGRTLGLTIKTVMDAFTSKKIKRARRYSK